MVCRIAKELGVPESATLEDTRQMVELKLDKVGHQPANVRIEAEETEQGLQDDEGVFVECQPNKGAEEEDDPARHAEERDGDSGGSSVDDVTREVEGQILEVEVEFACVTEENTALLEEVSSLKERVEVERMKYKYLWRDSCEQLMEHDSLVAEKETEIEALRPVLQT